MSAYRTLVNCFMGLVAAHWMEHILQLGQVLAGVPRPKALGALGWVFPWLVHSETLHFSFAIITLMGILLCKPYFNRAPGEWWWGLAGVLAVFHLGEHTSLFIQATLGAPRVGLLGTMFPRLELHLFYNAIITVPMLLAVYSRRLWQRQYDYRVLTNQPWW